MSALGHVHDNATEQTRPSEGCLMKPVFAVRFDMRHAPFSPVDEAAIYAESIAMSRFADEHGAIAVTVSEHHGVDFISAPITLAGAIVGATRSVRVTVNALLITLHDPVRLAEQIATLDLVSGGRFGIVAGLGYRHEEFAMAGVDRRQRGALAEEYLQVLRQAFSGEPFEWRGRNIVVTPKPKSPMEALVWAGGSVAASARRAARLRLPLFTMSVDPAIGDAYRAACAEVGYDGLFMAPSGPSFVHVSEDPERTWAQIGKYALYDATTYSSWQTHDHDNVVALESATTVDDLIASGMWTVVTPEQAVELGRTHGAVALHPLMGGIPPELGWESLHLFVDKVLPQL
jgi:alkanesulfonate monooxygenase SsuD/methylene tetrahydromethanopterin reductase-like flavin-dependent oxidoreductase (luciferase family)